MNNFWNRFYGVSSDVLQSAATVPGEVIWAVSDAISLDFGYMTNVGARLDSGSVQGQFKHSFWSLNGPVEEGIRGQYNSPTLWRAGPADLSLSGRIGNPIEVGGGFDFSKAQIDLGVAARIGDTDSWNLNGFSGVRFKPGELDAGNYVTLDLRWSTEGEDGSYLPNSRVTPGGIYAAGYLSWGSLVESAWTGAQNVVAGGIDNYFELAGQENPYWNLGNPIGKGSLPSGVTLGGLGNPDGKGDLYSGSDLYGGGFTGLDYGSAFTPDLSGIVAGDYDFADYSFDNTDFSTWSWDAGDFDASWSLSDDYYTGIDYSQFTGSDDFSFIGQDYSSFDSYSYDDMMSDFSFDSYSYDSSDYDFSYSFDDYSFDDYSFDSYDYSYDFSSDDSYYSDYDWSFPILLDLDGNGVKVTELSQSTTYLDSGDDGLSHRTAWAGAGDGVLFYDVGNDNLISEKREYVFTEWDPTATDDMAALRAAFDGNGDGKLTAADAAFASFKVMVTNADGTQTAQTLTALGITEIRLTQDATNIVLPDGAVITGQSLFTRSNGTTGTVANTTLATESMGYKIIKTQSVSAGTVTVDIKAFDATGALDHAEQTVTNATGTTRTVSYDNDGDGVWDNLQTIIKTTNADGSRTRERAANDNFRFMTAVA